MMWNGSIDGCIFDHSCVLIDVFECVDVYVLSNAAKFDDFIAIYIDFVAYFRIFSR